MLHLDRKLKYFTHFFFLPTFMNQVFYKEGKFYEVMQMKLLRLRQLLQSMPSGVCLQAQPSRVRRRWECYEFETSLVYIVSLRQARGT